MTFKHIFFALIAAGAFSSCVSDDKKTDVDWVPEFSDFNSQGYWTDCYKPGTTGVVVSDMLFSHSVESYDYDGVTYSSWFGFCPSKVNDTADHSDDWTSHQWASIAGGGVGGPDSPYIVACWNTTNANSCTLSLADHGVFYPDDLYVTNTTYGYYAMKNGTAFSRAFGPDDRCMLEITGYLNGVKKFSTIEIFLARGTDILDTWKNIEVSKLGSVDTMVFTMTSTDSGQWGMNTPAYFCIGSMGYTEMADYND
ncbi:MAG: DUF4465 domain-containing protein [Muribaculaceae bacterium]|nr:DUF4465 domain-containing protein [Muribaculaceae bacterium]